ncbi:expressed protein [Chlorella variabilis]|uniref:Expressed protein n=1 Tax=Chlorella variabilis TaxID=554065 RepID=E1ZE23_CHLVA|nr:expressed protein [Chlorella variabilis]EFN55795.1 expressed protein [Chlorella variabilis]|eukprot:XP_005847897.1 expressed protein [Chlorella variabilis]
MQDAQAPVVSLACACAAAVLSRPLSAAQRAVLDDKAFGAACSLRVALAVDGGRGQGLAFVSSELRGAQDPPTFWATPSERSLVGGTLRTGRTGALEGPAIHRLADLSHLNAAEGATSFLCIPIPAPGAPAAACASAALLLAYTSTAAAPQEELRLALLLAAQLSRRHGGALQEHAARLESTFHPTEHSPWGPGIDAQYPELSSSADSSDDEDSSGTGGDEHSHASSGSSASAGSPASLLGLSHRGGSSSGAASWAMSAKTLRFSDLRMERRFQHWRNARLARVDMTALLSLLVYHGACCLLPPFTDCHPGWLASSLLPALAVLAPLLLLLLNPSKHWYSRHRDQLLICTYLLLACHHALDLAAQLDQAPEGMWRVVVLRVEALWCLVLGIVLQVQFVGQCLMVVGSLLLKALVQPGCVQLLGAAAQTCSLVGPGAAAAASGCFLGDSGRSLLLKVAIPCGLAYHIELSARRTFCRILAGTSHQ